MELNEQVYVEQYQKEWKLLYQAEARRLRNALDGQNVRLEHIGSTSVPGLLAKPIVDILAGVGCFPPEKVVMRAIIDNGYRFMNDASVPDRLYFVKRGGFSFNLHIVEYRGNIWRKDLLFRDYLRTHPEAVEQYAAHKCAIVESGVHTLLEYSEKKAAFIAELLRKAEICADVKK